MGFMDDVREEQADRGRAAGARCLMCETIQTWPQPDAQDLADALADRTLFASTIIAVLKKRGIAATDNQVGNHRRQHVEGWRS